MPSRSFAMLPMVGLGGSAGGISALQAFFEATPDETGLAFVVVMHLAADHESMLAPFLQRATRMPVHQVRDSVKVEANHVYVIPPGKTIASANGYLQCTDITPERGRRVHRIACRSRTSCVWTKRLLNAGCAASAAGVASTTSA